MALNSTHNEKLQCSEQLLKNLVSTVGFLIEISTARQSVFVLSSGLNFLHSKVKCILRHGSKHRHHLVNQI